MNKLLAKFSVVVLMGLLCSCGGSKSPQNESREAKALLQGTWMDAETEDVLFQMRGDTVFYADSTSIPAYFWVVNDSLYIGSSSYHIEKQTEHLLWFKNQNGEVMRLKKIDEDEIPGVVVEQPSQVKIQQPSGVLKRDTVVFKGGQRYHCYIAINPTHYKIIYHTVNESGLEVDEVFYDNIVNISIFKGDNQIFKRDIYKKHFAKQVNPKFLEKAILNDMTFKQADDMGFHFIASLCEPNGVSCYLVDNIITEKGDIHMTLAE